MNGSLQRKETLNHKNVTQSVANSTAPIVGDENVVVTNKNLQEAARIREEIQATVKENTYVVQSARDESVRV